MYSVISREELEALTPREIGQRSLNYWYESRRESEREMIRGASVTLNKTQIDSLGATVMVDVNMPMHGGSMSTTPVEYILKVEDKGWKIYEEKWQ